MLGRAVLRARHPASSTHDGSEMLGRKALPDLQTRRLECLFPRPGQHSGGVDQPYHRIGLGKVAP